jgi:UDP-3-O-[3-hydroxymyristoyl] glucosamine N-acyltransferase
MITLIGRENAMLTNDMASNIRDSGVEVNKIHPDKFLAGEYNPDDEFIISYVTDMAIRKEIADYIDSNNLKRGTFIHPSAVIDKTAAVYPGSFIGPFSSVFYQCTIGKDVILGPYSMVSHLVSVEQGTVTNPSVMIAGGTRIGEYCLIGIRATFIDGIEICNDVKVGAGSVVTKTIETPGFYVGNPARKATQQ